VAGARSSTRPPTFPHVVEWGDDESTTGETKSPRCCRSARCSRHASTSAPLDAGIVDLPQLFATLRQVGYDGWIPVEDFTTEQPLADRVRENLRYLRASLNR
jgi:sugar phosphate isomerase/epimerase